MLDSSLPADLLDLKARFDSYRQNCKHNRQPFPAELCPCCLRNNQPLSLCSRPAYRGQITFPTASTGAASVKIKQIALVAKPPGCFNWWRPQAICTSPSADAISSKFIFSFHHAGNCRLASPYREFILILNYLSPNCWVIWPTFRNLDFHRWS